MKWIGIFFVYLAWASNFGWAEGIINPNPLKILSHQVETSQLPVGANTSLKIDVELAELHHAYQEQFRILSPVEWLQVSKPEVNPVVEFFDPVSKKTKIGIQAGLSQISAVIGATENAPQGPQRVTLELVYQACTKTYCLLPKKVPFEIDLLVGNAQAAWRPKTPSLLSVKSLSDLEAVLESSLGLTFLIVFIAGFLTSLTPCIFPMIPITLAVLGARSEGRTRMAGLGLALSYVLGIATTYSILGLIAASTGALFGSFLGHPMVAIALGILFFVMGLGMFGLFEVQVPAFLRNRLGLHKTKGGWMGAFFTGQVSGLLASPCIGPVLVALLAYVAKSQDLPLGFLLLFTFAFGMGQIFLVLGTFSHALGRLPKAGPWMVTIKIIMGLMMMGLSFFYVQPIIPKNLLGSSSEAPMDQVISWQTYSDETFAKARSEGKAIVIDFYADWCAACIEMEIKTFPTAKIQEIKDKFVWIKFDATDTSTPGFEELRKKYEIPGLPWFVFYSPTGQHLKDLTLAGFENESEFRARLDKVLGSR